MFSAIAPVFVDVPKPLYGEAPDSEVFEVPGPSQEEKVSNPFYFEDSQVVLQASHTVISHPSIH
jgi:hypothetical protein